MAFDFFVAKFRCPLCGTVSPEDTSTNMQTKLQATPQGSYLHVGDKLDMRSKGPASGGYLTIREPLPEEPVHILEVWECPACGQPFNWAEIVLKDDVIESMKAVELDKGSLDRVHFISWLLEYVYPSITGHDLYTNNNLRPDFLEQLYEHLPH